MSEVAAPPERARVGWRLRLLVVLALAITAFAVLGTIQTLHYSSGTAKLPMATGVGFFMPKSTKPVAFSLPHLSAAGGGTTTMSELAGKPVVLNFWASDCSVCKTETPAFDSVARSIGSQVTFVGIDSADEHAPAVAFLDKYGEAYLQLYDHSALVASAYGIAALPVTVFISAQGKVVGENVGALSAAGLRHYLSTLFGI